MNSIYGQAILFTFKDGSSSTKAQAKREAQMVLTEIKGVDFAEMARIHGTDGTASRVEIWAGLVKIRF